MQNVCLRTSSPLILFAAACAELFTVDDEEEDADEDFV